MSSKVQAMASWLHDETKPRRFDLTMSRRTRRPAASLAANFHQEDHATIQGSQTMTQPEHQVQDFKLNAAPASQCLCLSDHLQSRHSEDTEESETQQHQQEECQDDSRRFSLQELIEDETAIDGEKDAVTGGHEDDPASEAVDQGVSGAAAAGWPEEHVAGRKVIGMMRRYVRVRSIKTKHAPEKNVAPIC